MQEAASHPSDIIAFLRHRARSPCYCWQSEPLHMRKMAWHALQRNMRMHGLCPDTTTTKKHYVLCQGNNDLL